MTNNLFHKNNIFDNAIISNADSSEETFEYLLVNDKVKIERIISSGQHTPENEWLEQDIDEWVILLQGKSTLAFHDDQSITLSKGDYIHIPANTKHRVEYTSSDPVCIWLAIHF